MVWERNGHERGQMPELLHWSERIGCGATLRLDSGEPCLISIAQTSVRVRKSRFGFFGTTLYEEKNIYLAAQTGVALRDRFPEWRLPVTMKNPVLAAFANAAWHCSTTADVAITLGKTAQAARNSP